MFANASKGTAQMQILNFAKKVAPKKPTAQYSRSAKRSKVKFGKGEPTKKYLLAYADHLRYSFIFDVAINDFAAREEAADKIKKAEHRMKIAQKDYDFDVEIAQRESEKICIQYQTQYANVRKTMQT